MIKIKSYSCDNYLDKQRSGDGLDSIGNYSHLHHFRLVILKDLKSSFFVLLDDILPSWLFNVKLFLASSFKKKIAG